MPQRGSGRASPGTRKLGTVKLADMAEREGARLNDRNGFTDDALQSARKPLWRRWWFVLIAIVVIAGATIPIVFWAKYKYLRAHADEILRDRIVASLSARFNSPVELDSFHLDIGPTIHATGGGLRILYLAGPTKPDANPNNPAPMISVDHFEFQTDFKALLEPTTRIVNVYVNGLDLHVPPHGMGHIPRHLDNPNPKKQPKISVVFDKIICENSRLVIETTKPGKLPLVFQLAKITLTDVGATKPLLYDAVLTNARPVGLIHSTGHFGPWHADDPRDTPIDGDYSFLNADLGPFKGIAGILSSTGNFNGKLDHINVEGVTDVPDFRLDISDHPVPLHTEFTAIVNGTTGDTTLTRVDARLQKSVFHCSGSVMRVGVPATGVTGHDIELDVVMNKGRMEDVLTLATKTAPPVMAGYLSLHHKLSIPPGKETVAKRMKLAGTFNVDQASFGNPAMQLKIDEMSMRAQGNPKAANKTDATPVASSVAGEFVQTGGTMHFSTLDYTIPGAVIRLQGTYTLQGNSFDFQGVVRTDATASQMTTGWKSMLLKAVDPMLRKNGAGLEIPITIKGTKADPHFSIDMKKMF